METLVFSFSFCLFTKINIFDCELYVKNNSIDNYDTSIRNFFKSVSLVYKLRETRAFIGFSRLEPANKTIEEFRKHLSSDEEINWIPAIQVNGEGIMIEFNEDAIEKWKTNKEVLKRCEKMTNNLNASAFGKKEPIKLLNPEYVLIHTFAHILISELSKKVVMVHRLYAKDYMLVNQSNVKCWVY